MTQHELILNYIKQFRDLGAENCFANGMCYHFTVLLRQRFGSAGMTFAKRTPPSPKESVEIVFLKSPMESKVASYVLIVSTMRFSIASFATLIISP